MTRSLAVCLLAMGWIGCGPAGHGDDDDDPRVDASVDARTADAGAPDGGECATSCSADLHAVVDCEGNVLSTCPADQGCSAGGCVAPCQAAVDNQSSIGCEYYAVDPDVISLGWGGCYAAFIANTWGTPATIAVDRGGVALPVAGFARIPSGSGAGLTYAPLVNGELLPGQVAILFLAQSGAQLPACPGGVTPAYAGADAAVHGTARGVAFHLTSSVPVVAYDIFPYGGGDSAISSATLLLPTSVWGDDYVAVDAFRRGSFGNDVQPSMAVVARDDDTTVTIRPKAPIVGGPGVAAAPIGIPTTYSLDRGEVLQLTQPQELAGSVITADKPIGHWAGATCLTIDVGDLACDSAHQQIPPVAALGHRYAAVRYRNRYPGHEESVPWRLVGAADGTTLTYLPSTPPGAPTSLALGQVAEFWGPGPFTVASQDDDHPFYLSQHMTGCRREASDPMDCRGDPEFINVIPDEQWLASYTFFTDPTYPETNLVLVRERRDGGFADVTVDCAGVVGGWTDLDAAGDVQYTRLDLVTGNFQGVHGCDNGVHAARSAQPFGLVVWGWGSAATPGFFSQAVSYAYPAGASVKPINTVEIVVN